MCSFGLVVLCQQTILMSKTVVNVSDQLKALSDSLSKLGCEHVYIGGFAMGAAWEQSSN